MNIYIYEGPGNYIGAIVVVMAKSKITALKSIKNCLYNVPKVPNDIDEYVTMYRVPELVNGQILLRQDGDY